MLTSGETYTISWSTVPTATKYRLMYSTNNGVSWAVISNDVPGTTYQWVVPAVAAAESDWLIYVKAYDGLGDQISSGKSDAAFTINPPPPALQILAPNGGEMLTSGETYTISWSTVPTATKYRLMYSDNNGVSWTVISNDVLGTTYQWVVPAVATAESDWLIYVKAYDGLGVQISSGKSDAAFTVNPPPPALQILAPNGGEMLTSGETYTISWSTVPTATKYRLMYSDNNGVSWPVMSNDVPGTTYQWVVPAAIAVETDWLIYVKAYDASGVFLASDISDGNFIVNP
jgi:hypothetical protein